jgi:hypothetical protein
MVDTQLERLPKREGADQFAGSARYLRSPASADGVAALR